MGRRLGALEGGGGWYLQRPDGMSHRGYPPPFQCIPAQTPYYVLLSNTRPRQEPELSRNQHTSVGPSAGCAGRERHVRSPFPLLTPQRSHDDETLSPLEPSIVLFCLLH